MPDLACPRCGVPLHDEPDYCWSCGFYVGDRWRTPQLTEGDAGTPRVVDPVDTAADHRVVGGGTGRAGSSAGGLPRSSARSQVGGGRWLVRLVALATLVIIGLLALALFGGGDGGAATIAPSTPPIGSAGAAASTLGPATASILAPAGPTGPTTDARVTRVVDGDTVIVDIDGESFRLRYIGMDTPESVKPDTPIEPLAEAAAAANRELVDRRQVVLERDVSETDQYGRLLRDVWVERDGALVMVGLELVLRGLAQVTTYPPDVKYVDQLVAAQAAAREAGLGVWATP